MVTLRVRISDNVLEEKAWPVEEVTISRGAIVAQRSIERGHAYAFPEMVGWTTAALIEWLNYDSTGEHPEVYNEALFEGRWSSTWKL